MQHVTYFLVSHGSIFDRKVPAKQFILDMHRNPDIPLQFSMSTIGGSAPKHLVHISLDVKWHWSEKRHFWGVLDDTKMAHFEKWSKLETQTRCIHTHS